MTKIIDINNIQLLLSFLTLLIPILFLRYYKVKISKSIIISALRMIVQLSLVAIYLEWVFDVNNAWVNAIWVIIMILVSSVTTIKRSEINWKYFFIPIFISTLSSIIITDAFFLGFVIKLNYIFETQYFIPITGMIIGNALKHNIVGLHAYIKELHGNENFYQFILTNSSSKRLAIRPFIANAAKQGLSPLIASMSVIGLISLPGMMTGQLLSGSEPAVAIKYQIMIMLAIFVGCSLNLFLSIIISNKYIFDDYGNIIHSVFNNVNVKK